MANHGKYHIAIRLLLPNQYPETNAGRDALQKALSHDAGCTDFYQKHP